MYFIYYYEADEEVPLNLVHQHRFHKPCQSMTAIFVRDFGLAKISFTIPGTLKLQKAWAEFTGGDFVSGKDIDDLLDAINREFYKGAADHIEDQLYQTFTREDIDRLPDPLIHLVGQGNYARIS
ncbi:hypothetical protein TWF225_005754 [Orbilia oligospora]|nr:hypothetical protein TWF225_005754 [Orbilia oligospora]KAF3271321.1 hypothetical protein TWF217_005719 [Orbilia oligospora]KAF3293542.1 hypothetical protein TWF132_004510 [Orbilia oligospora]